MVNTRMDYKTILIRGAGEMATGIGVRLYNSGFNILMTETQKPSSIRRKVSFSEVVYEGETEVEGVKARLAKDNEDIYSLWKAGFVPVVIDPELKSVGLVRPYSVVDATLVKKNKGVNKDMAPLVIGVGPGFAAKEDCHVVIESMRGHDLGRLIYKGGAQANTGVPGDIIGFTAQRVIYAPTPGVIQLLSEIGDLVEKDQTIAYVAGVPVKSPISGVLRGIIRDKYLVKKGMKLGDVDPRGIVENCYTISDKARALGGSVLEALLNSTIR